MGNVRKTVILAVLAALAAAYLLYSYGIALPASPFTPLAFDAPVVADSDGEATIVADSGSRRVLMINGEGQLTGIVDCNTFDAPFEAVTDVCVSDGVFYIAGVNYLPDSDIIKQERVVAYGKGGSPLGIVYERNDLAVQIKTIKSIDAAPGGVVAGIAKGVQKDEDQLNSNLAFVFINVADEREIKETSICVGLVHDVSYSAADDRYVFLSLWGVLEEGVEQAWEIPDRVFTAVAVGEGGMTYANDDASGALCSISKDGKVKELVAGSGYESLHVNGETVTLSDSETNTVKTYGLDGSVKLEMNGAFPSVGFAVRVVLLWLAGLYLVVLAAVFGVRKTRRLVASGQTEGFGPMLASIAVVVAVAVAVGNLSFASYNALLTTRAREINMCADYLAYDAADLSAAMEKCGSRDALRGTNEEVFAVIDGLMGATRYVDTLTSSATENGLGMYYTLYGKDDKGVFYLVDSSSEHVMGTSSLPIMNSVHLAALFTGGGEESQELFLGRNLRDTTLYRLVPIPTSDGKGVAGVIEIGSKMNSFESSLTADLAQRILALLVMILVVYLTYSELRACGRCLFSYRKLREESRRDAVATLTRPFTFCITILSSIDAVMTVLIARDLLTSSGLGDSTLLLAVPSVMLGIGLVAGQGLYGLVGARVGLRKLVIIGALAMFVCAGFTALAVLMGPFWLYCVAKLVMSVPFGLLYTLGYSLPRVAETDESRAVAAGGVKRTDTSAAALGTVLGGYAAQTIGNAWVYALVAIACIPVLVMALNLLPKRSKPLEVIAGRAQGKGHVIGFVMSRPVLSIALLVVLPVTVAAGYASFLFPLFSADLGLSKADINNIYVLGQLVVFVFISIIEGAEGRFGKWRVTLAAVSLLGVVFLLFSLNTTLVWSIAVIAIVGVLCKVADSWKGLWQQAAADAGVPPGRAVGAMFATRSVALVVQPFILGGLLGATDVVTVLVIGALCVVCAIAFYFSTRSTWRQTT